MDEESYDNGNRAFLQAFMARSSMTFEEAQPVLAAIRSANEDRRVQPEDITHEDLHSYIAAANAAISPFDLEIRSTPRQTAQVDREQTGAPEKVYALVNTTSDPLTQLATTYTADEIAFVNRVFDAMFDTHNTRRSESMVITAMQAIQLAKGSAGDTNRRQSGNATQQQSQSGASQSLSMSQAEGMMTRLVEEGWLEKSRNGYYSLSPRGLMELRGWLVETYNGETEDGNWVDKIKYCAACGEIIIAGQRCGSRDCSGRLHDSCMRNFFRMQRAETCPVCRAPWPGDKFVGERAVTSSEGQRQGNRKNTNTQRRSNAGASQPVATQNGVESGGEVSG